MQSLIIKAWRENKAFLLFIGLMLVFRSAVADWNEVPTGSMKPTIVEGDRILVNKMAYDVRVPFTHISLHKIADPSRGDIIVFDSKVSQKRLVKRVVGLPEDDIELNNNILLVNGKQLDYQTVPSQGTYVEKVEMLLGFDHSIQISQHGSSRSTFPRTKVPLGHYLVLGDNRDNSADSRVIGFVPREEIVGRSKRVVMSLNYDNYYLPRKERFFHQL